MLIKLQEIALVHLRVEFRCPRRFHIFRKTAEVQLQRQFYVLHLPVAYILREPACILNQKAVWIHNLYLVQSTVYAFLDRLRRFLSLYLGLDLSLGLGFLLLLNKKIHALYAIDNHTVAVFKVMLHAFEERNEAVLFVRDVADNVLLWVFAVLV